MLPIDLVLVRHGQSEGNAAKRRSEKGDHTAFTPEFLDRHTSSFRLTALGREQARAAGAYLRDEFYRNGYGFDRFLVSEYLRAKETAALLELPKARWYCDSYLSERDWGDLDVCPENERAEKFGEALRRRIVEPFFWRPPNGESFAQLCQRVDRVLHTLHRECDQKRVVAVCHGETMLAFRVRLERMSQERFRELHLSPKSEERLHNCQVLHYSRREPGTGRIANHANWLRMIRPTDTPVWETPWQEIERPVYTNEELLAEVLKTPAMIS